MIPFSPALLQVGLYAALGAAVFVGGCNYGKSGEEALRLAERASYADAAAQAEKRNRLKERENNERVQQADIEREKTLDAVVQSGRAELSGLRNALAARSRRVPDSPTATVSSAPSPRCATAAELLGIGEELVRVATAADTERSAVMACASAWPR